MNSIRRFLTATALLVAVGLATPVAAQTTITTTTTTAAMTASQVTTPGTVALASTTDVIAGAELFIDAEAMSVQSVNTSTKIATVFRGFDGTKAAPHINGATVYVGPAAAVGLAGLSPFVLTDPPIGSCTATSEVYNLRINVQNGRIWQCTNSQWMNVIDSYVFVSPGACQSSVSGNATGTNGLTTIGSAPSQPVVQASTSGTGTNTHYYQCNIPVPSRTNTVKGAYLVDAEFYYGTQTTALGTQVATLASGTMNSTTVFQSIAYPVPGASETATGISQLARADAGTLLITPVVGSFNTGTTTAGQFFSVKFTPANPIALVTDHTVYLLTVALLNTATSATVTNSPGFLVHYRSLLSGI